MRNRFRFTPAGLVVLAALALPAGAAAKIDVAVSSVKAHTKSADAALDRAVSLFEQNAQQKATKAFEESRDELRAARSDAAKLVKQADSAREHAKAAKAQTIVAEQFDENIDQIAGSLEKARAKVENPIAQAALSDTYGRDKALGILAALFGQVPEQAKPWIAQAIASLSQGHEAEITVEVEALVSDAVSAAAKEKVVDAIGASVDGQATAAAKLAELIASEDMPEESKPGLQTAYDAVIAEQEGSATVLEDHLSLLPDHIRAMVEQIVQEARENAQEMKENHPTGPPEGTGPPEEPGPPSETPGPPAGLPLVLPLP